jgi:signal transduction histidine kinase
MDRETERAPEGVMGEMTDTGLPRAVAQSLCEAIESISSELTLAELLPKIVANTASLLGASASAVSRAQYDEHTTRLAAVYNLPQSLIGESYPSEQAPTSELLASGELIVLDEEHQLDGSFPLRDVYITLHWLAVPLRWRDTYYGSLSLAVDPPHHFRPHDPEVLAIFARYVAIAIANARLHERARHAAILDERQRLARELHDSVTQTLFALQAAAQAAQDRWETQREGARAAVELVQQLARAANVEMRALLYELRDGALVQEGLASALEKHVALIRHQTGLVIELTAADDLHLPAPYEEVIYRIIQEALSNVVKHARARQVGITVGRGEGCVWARVEDDGRGFPQGNPAFDSFGLRGMRERVSAVNGLLRLGNRHAGGACVCIALPIPTDQSAR